MKSSSIMPFKSIIKNVLMPDMSDSTSTATTATSTTARSDYPKSHSSLDISQHLLKVMQEMDLLQRQQQQKPPPPAAAETTQQGSAHALKEEKRRQVYYKSNPLKGFAPTKGQPVIPPHHNTASLLPERFNELRLRQSSPQSVDRELHKKKLRTTLNLSSCMDNVNASSLETRLNSFYQSNKTPVLPKRRKRSPNRQKDEEESQGSESPSSSLQIEARLAPSKAKSELSDEIRKRKHAIAATTPAAAVSERWYKYDSEHKGSVYNYRQAMRALNKFYAVHTRYHLSEPPAQLPIIESSQEHFVGEEPVAATNNTTNNEIATAPMAQNNNVDSTNCAEAPLTTRRDEETTSNNNMQTTAAEPPLPPQPIVIRVNNPSEQQQLVNSINNFDETAADEDIVEHVQHHHQHHFYHHQQPELIYSTNVQTPSARHKQRVQQARDKILADAQEKHMLNRMTILQPFEDTKIIMNIDQVSSKVLNTLLNKQNSAPRYFIPPARAFGYLRRSNTFHSTASSSSTNQAVRPKRSSAVTNAPKKSGTEFILTSKSQRQLDHKSLNSKE